MLFSKLLCNQNKLLSFYIRGISTTSNKYKTHYDTLNLPRNCSTNEIRNSYLKLSKKYHPDRNKDENSHKEFVKISTAYNVLSKPGSRYEYDLGLSNPFGSTTIRRAPQGVWTDDIFWEQRDKSKDSYYKSRPYYGIKGVKKLPNEVILLLCIGFTFFGVMLQIVLIRRSFTLRRTDMQKHSDELEKLHSEIRARALANGDKKQLELVIERINKDNNVKHRHKINLNT